MKITRFVLLAAALVVTGCAPDITDTEFFREHPLQAPAGDVISITEGQFGDITFRILAADSLHFGHSSFLVEAERNGEVLDNGSLTVRTRWVTDSRLLPMPATSTISSVDEDGRYLSKAYFLQPVAETGIWEMSIDFDIGGSQGTLDLDVDVVPGIWIQHVTASDDYYVSWDNPESPVTGSDEFEISLLQVTEQGFIPVTDAQIDLYPYMDMGAGEGHSTPFEKPVHIGDGEYRGMVNFIMAGGWDMTVYVQRPLSAPDTVLFQGFIVNQGG